jgi:hypothetical protein
VIRELRRRGQLRGPGALWNAAALAAALVLGFAAGQLSARGAAPGADATEGESWLLLLRGGDPATGDELPSRVEAIRSWSLELRRAGVAIEGARLASGAEWLGDAPGNRLAPEVGGYFEIRGVDREQALAIASGCPLLGFGGQIELRRVAGSGEARR